MLTLVKEKMIERENSLSSYATKSIDAIRYIDETDDIDIRPSFFRDVDRIIHSFSYTRYGNKTQVYSFSSNDHVTKRIVHVQLVSKIARTIGRALSLNEDLIEAMALGHDIGHTPLGHPGEAMLNRISMRELGEMFNHNVHSVRTFMDIENNGKGINLSVQTLDGILCHNGELLSPVYKPIEKTKEQFLEEYNMCYTDKEVLKKLCPMTLEGCVVRISDIIGYIGRDIEDAIKVGKISRDDIPNNIKKVLGTTNKEIVNTIILNIIANSLDKPYIAMSHEVFEAVLDLKNFNYEHIYNLANSKSELDYYERGMNLLFEKYLNDIYCENYESDIYIVFLKDKNRKYMDNTSPKRMVIDYLAGMTDTYLKRMIEKNTELRK